MLGLILIQLSSSESVTLTGTQINTAINRDKIFSEGNIAAFRIPILLRFNVTKLILLNSFGR